MKIVYLFLSIIISITVSHGQIKDALILKRNNDFERSFETLTMPNGIQVLKQKPICPDLGLLVIEISKEIEIEEMLEIQQLNGLENIWYDQKIEYRTAPNDTEYDQQWAITLSNIDEVWDFTTGGKTANGKEIIIGVLDDGFSLNHIDLQNVFWENPREIPNNNKDDDGNGYIDDYIGLNINIGDDSHPVKTHGTSVTGIIGANGNNNEGVAGVNWDIKILPVSEVDKVSEIIESYNYLLNLRRKYNDSNGEEGAFIAITSYSGGVSDVFGTEGIYKEWCELYQLLGSEGVLNFGATDNRFVDVDEVGDMPSTCTSDYFISVTSLLRGGNVDMESAYGKTSVDIAAPGDKIITTKPNDSYGDFEGTSAATPMVAGSAALLYSTPCEKFGELIDKSPSESVRVIRNVLLQGVSKSNEMTDLYSSGGYLDVQRALKQMDEICEGELQIESERGALRIVDLIRNNNTVTLFYISPNEDPHFVRWVDAAGRTLFHKEIIPQSFGEKNVSIEIPFGALGPTYLSLGNKKHTVSQGFFIRN